MSGELPEPPPSQPDGVPDAPDSTPTLELLQPPTAEAHWAEAVRSQRPLGSYGLIGACAAVFLLQLLWGGVETRGAVLYAMGSDFGPAVREGEAWRLFASAFLHANPVHLLLNMAALASFGPLLERIIGTARYLVLYALAALGGAVLSGLIHNDVPSVGASGAIWGLMGGALAVGLRPQGALPAANAQLLVKRLIQPLVLNLGYSFSGGIDLAAHLGGGLFGFGVVASGLVMGGLARPFESPPRQGSPAADRLWQFSAASAALAMAASLAVAMLHGRPWEIATPPATVAVHVERTGVTLDVPRNMATAHPGTIAGGTQVSFGDLDSSVAQANVRVFAAGPTLSFAREPQLQRELAAALPTPGKDLKLSAPPVAVTVGGHPAMTEEMTGANGYRVRLWSMRLGDEVVVLSVHLADATQAWSDAASAMAASLKSASREPAELTRVHPPRAPFSIELPAGLELQPDPDDGKSYPPGGVYGALADRGAYAVVELAETARSDEDLAALQRQLFEHEQEPLAILGLPAIKAPEVVTLGGVKALHELAAKADGSLRVHRYLTFVGRHLVRIQLIDGYDPEALEPLHAKILASLRADEPVPAR